MNNMKLNILIFCAFAFIASCGNQEQGSEGSEDVTTSKVKVITKEQFDRVGMKTGGFKQYVFSERVKVNGKITVSPKDKAIVSPYFGGYVVGINLLPGEFVRKGQTLFLIKNPVFIQMQQDYIEAKSRLKFLKADYERKNELHNDSVVSKKDFLKSESDYKVTSAQVRALYEKLKMININPEKISEESFFSSVQVISPISGQISKVNVTTGQYVNPGDEAIMIVNDAMKYLELFVFEKDISKIKAGQQVSFKLPDNEKRIFKATISEVSRSIDPEKNTAVVMALIEHEEGYEFLANGMYVDAGLTTAEKKYPSLPTRAINEADSEMLVYQLIKKNDQEYHFLPKKVMVGVIEDRHSQILNAEDFSPEAVFLIDGIFHIAD